MFKRKPKELVEVKKVNKMLNAILDTERTMTQGGDYYTMCCSAIPTSNVLEIARKYGFLKG
jgi:hypothetical protein